MKILLFSLLMTITGVSYAGSTRAPGANYPESALRSYNFKTTQKIDNSDCSQCPRRGDCKRRARARAHNYYDCPGFYYNRQTRESFYYSTDGYYDRRGRFYHQKG